MFFRPRVAILAELSGCFFSTLCWRPVTAMEFSRAGVLSRVQRQKLGGLEQDGHVGLRLSGAERVAITEVRVCETLMAIGVGFCGDLNMEKTGLLLVRDGFPSENSIGIEDVNFGSRL